MAKKIDYREGDCVAVPLGHGSYAIAIITRKDSGGRLGSKIVYIYCFGPRLEKPRLSPCHLEMGPQQSIYQCRVGDLYIVQGRWLLLASLLNFDRASWPLPVFGQLPPGSTCGYAVIYGDDLAQPVERVPIDRQKAESMPQHALDGPGFVEARLTRLLSPDH